VDRNILRLQFNFYKFKVINGVRAGGVSTKGEGWYALKAAN